MELISGSVYPPNLRCGGGSDVRSHGAGPPFHALRGQDDVSSSNSPRIFPVELVEVSRRPWLPRLPSVLEMHVFVFQNSGSDAWLLWPPWLPLGDICFLIMYILFVCPLLCIYI